MRPALPLLCYVAATLACVMSGAFGTGTSLPAAARLLFWAVLLGINFAKWQLLMMGAFRLLGPTPRTFPLAALAGALLLNLTLPLEIRWTARLAGTEMSVPFAATYGMAVALSLLSGLLAWAVERRGAAMPASALPELAADDPAPGVAAAVPSPTGLLARAEVRAADQVTAVEAEDHYLRVFLADGRAPLVHYRMKDALLELAALDGMQVHRGHWVAAPAVAGAEREGKRWLLVLRDGRRVPVSESFAPAARARGWLAARLPSS